MKSIIVSQSHTIDDLSIELAAHKRANSDAYWALVMASDASHEGDHQVCREYIERAISALNKAATS